MKLLSATSLLFAASAAAVAATAPEVGVDGPFLPGTTLKAVVPKDVHVPVLKADAAGIRGAIAPGGPLLGDGVLKTETEVPCANGSKRLAGSWRLTLKFSNYCNLKKYYGRVSMCNGKRAILDAVPMAGESDFDSCTTFEVDKVNVCSADDLRCKAGRDGCRKYGIKQIGRVRAVGGGWADVGTWDKMLTCVNQGMAITDAQFTPAPTEAPTDAPSQAPTDVPSQAPTDAPSQAPTDAPSQAPTDAPSQAPTDVPSQAPTDASSQAPTDVPSQAPSVVPCADGSKRLAGSWRLTLKFSIYCNLKKYYGRVSMCNGKRAILDAVPMAGESDFDSCTTFEVDKVNTCSADDLRCKAGRDGCRKYGIKQIGRVRAVGGGWADVGTYDKMLTCTNQKMAITDAQFTPAPIAIPA